MSNDTDYRELVDGTIDEVKERVQEDDLDPRKVLEAEQDNKDRVTLVEWLEDQIETADDTQDEQEPAPADEAEDEPDQVLDDEALEPEPLQPEMDGDAPVGPARNRSYALIGSGLILGFLVASVAFAAGVVPVPMASDAAVSPQDAQAELDSFFEENKAALQLPPGSDISVQSISQYQNSDMYEAQLRIAISLNNETMDQTRPAYVTQDGRYVFFSQPLDTTQSIESQIQQPSQPQQPTGNVTGAQ